MGHCTYPSCNKTDQGCLRLDCGFVPSSFEPAGSTADELDLQHRINMAFTILKTAIDEQPDNVLIKMAIDWLDNDRISR